MMMDIKEIQQLLPHRYPFLLVDRIIEIIPGVKAVGIKNIRAARLSPLNGTKEALPPAPGPRLSKHPAL